MGRFKHLVDFPAGMEGFRAKYHLLQGVALRYCALDQIVIDRKEGEVVIPMIAFIKGGMTLLTAREDLPPVELPFQRIPCEVVVSREETTFSRLSLEAEIDQFHLEEEGEAPERLVELSNYEVDFDRSSTAHPSRLVVAQVGNSSEEEEDMTSNSMRGLKDFIAGRNKGSSSKENPRLELDGAALPWNSSIREFQRGHAYHMVEALERPILLPKDMEALRKIRQPELFLSLKRDLAFAI
nr:hypothetical protein CFP56_23247 [Quercus suber]